MKIQSFANRFTINLNYFLHPLTPPRPVSINEPVRLELRALGVEEVAQLAAAEADLYLVPLVKAVEAWAQGVAQGPDVACRVKGVPRADARLALARLEHQEQSVESRNHLIEGHAQQSGGPL